MCFALFKWLVNVGSLLNFFLHALQYVSNAASAVFFENGDGAAAGLAGSTGAMTARFGRSYGRIDCSGWYTIRRVRSYGNLAGLSAFPTVICLNV